ncbi:type II restriction endonuclease [Lacrimispora amygdalina]|uniref:Type II restriction endonuclease n=1 Tax=Lacrimispora amygdalina TaxID=253257 RepID=A0ABQ5M556_9FIRM
MESHSMMAIQAALQGQVAFCKFLSANDTGKTGGHQAGIYISKASSPILFNEPGNKGQNKEKWVKIKWQNDFETDTRFIYYGQGTRNEYRITNFGSGFPFLHTDYTGALFVFVKNTEDDYQGFILNTDEEINKFLDAFGLSPTETNKLIETTRPDPEIHEKLAIEQFIDGLSVEFPTSEEMSVAARSIHNQVYNHQELIRSNPDKQLLDWTATEFRLFRALEYVRYDKMFTNGFSSVDAFINAANQVLNRRKSRAGKSLEHHLSAIFDGNNVQYKAQAITEGNKKPDFIFPSQEAYHDLTFPTEEIVSLAAKTTCKDRWRQVINEADRLRDHNKYLCTLQRGISAKQMDEMQAEKVILVVPKPYIPSFPEDRRDRIWTIGRFVQYIKKLENR